MYAFNQHRPTTVRQAANLLGKQEEAKLLAGGHTLIPTMKLRLAGTQHNGTCRAGTCTGGAPVTARTSTCRRSRA